MTRQLQFNFHITNNHDNPQVDGGRRWKKNKSIMLFCVKQIRPSGGAKCNLRRSGEAERCCLSQQAPEFCAAALNCTSKNPDQKAAKVIQVCMCEGECVLVCVRESSPS